MALTPRRSDSSLVDKLLQQENKVNALIRRASGAAILSGTGAPASTLGKDGDTYRDVAANVWYGPKANGAWPAGVSGTSTNSTTIRQATDYDDTYAPATGQGIIWNGAKYAPANIAGGGGGSSGSSVTTGFPAIAAGGSWTWTHGLGTRNVAVQVYRTAAPYDDVTVYFERTDINSVTFSPDVSINAGDYTVVAMTTAAPSSSTALPGIAAGSSWAWTHGLGSKSIVVQVYRSTAPYDDVAVYYERTDNNTVTFRPDVSISAGDYTVVALGGSSPVPAVCRVKLNADFPLAANSSVFAQTSWIVGEDPDNLATLSQTVGALSYITIPVTGRYIVTVNGIFTSPSAAGTCVAFVTKNAADVNSSIVRDPRNTSNAGGDGTVCSKSRPVMLTAGDKLYWGHWSSVVTTVSAVNLNIPTEISILQDGSR